MAKIAKFFEPKLRVVLYKICSEICYKNHRKKPVPNYLFYNLQAVGTQLYGKEDPGVWLLR